MAMTARDASSRQDRLREAVAEVAQGLPQSMRDMGLQLQL